MLWAQVFSMDGFMHEDNAKKSYQILNGLRMPIEKVGKSFQLT
jgi:hypothetical protein